MKVKFGLGANVLAIKKRNLSDISTFIDQETEVGNPLSKEPLLNPLLYLYFFKIHIHLVGSNERRSDGLGGKVHAENG